MEEPPFAQKWRQSFAGVLPCKSELVLDLTGQRDGVSSCLFTSRVHLGTSSPGAPLLISKISVNDTIFSTHCWEKLNLLAKPSQRCNEHIIAEGEERKKLGVSLYLGQHQSLSVTYSLVLWEACG